MQRLLVALLAAFDALVAAAVGVAAALAPLTLLWVFGLGAAGTGGAPWSLLWPASAAVWQLGNLVPIHIHLPGEYLAVTGIPAEAASFVVSLAPLAFAGFTALFAARSGGRAARAGAWVVGVVAGSAVYAIAAAAVCFTTRNGVAAVHAWQAVLFPALLFALPALVGAIVAAWRDGDGGVVDRVHDRVDAWDDAWRRLPELAVRGAGIVLTGLIGLGALVVVIALIAHGGEVIGLYEAGNMTLLGVVVVSLAQLAYLPTLVVWGLSFVAGPGFALGTGTAVSPSGTEVGVVPGIPLLGALPHAASPWMLALVVLPIAVAVFAGWVIRSRLVAETRADHAAPRMPAALTGLVSAAPVLDADEPPHDPIAPRLVLTAGTAVLAAAGAALLAVAASGSLGPGRLAAVGPDALAVALAVGVETLIGVGILVLSPRRERDPAFDDRPAASGGRGEAAGRGVPAAFWDEPETRDDDRRVEPEPEPESEPEPAPLPRPERTVRLGWRPSAPPRAPSPEDEKETAPVDTEWIAPDEPAPTPQPAASRPDLGPDRPSPLPPVD
jgi:hypothetical protein